MLETLLLTFAVAQAPAAPPAPPPPAAAPAAPAAPAPNDAAWQAYNAGAAKLAEGDIAAARSALGAVLRNHPGHPAAVAAAKLLGGLPKAAPASQPPPPPPPAAAAPLPPPPAPQAQPQPPPAAATAPPAPADTPSHIKKSGAGRTLLVGVQTLHGLVVGLEVCMILDCNDFRAIGPAMGVGTLAGLLGSLRYSRDGISYGKAAAIDAGTALGFAHGALLAFATETDDARAAGGMLLAGQVVGTVVGANIWESLGRPSLDDMAFAAGAGLLSLYVTSPAWAGDESTEQGLRGLAALAIMDGAIATAWVIRGELPMSWGRAGIITASAFAGALGGLGVDGLIEGDDPNPTALVTLMAAGAYTGAILGTLWTRGFDQSSATASRMELVPTVVPTEGGGLMGLGATW